MRVNDCHIIGLPSVSDDRGNLSFVEGSNHIPFEIKRIYYLYDIPSDRARGAHAHKKLRQLFIAVSGSFDILLDDGQGKAQFHLDSPSDGLYVCPMIWRDIVDFSPGAVCLVLASEHFDEADYFRDYQDYLAAKELVR